MKKNKIIIFFAVILSICFLIFVTRLTLNYLGYRIPILENILTTFTQIGQVNKEYQSANKDKQINRQKGVKLTLKGISKENENVLINNFSMVENEFENITSDRPDLQSAEMIYDAQRKKVEFVYYYTPNPEDIDTTTRNDLVFINIIKYNLIGRSISYYLNKCFLDFTKLNIQMDTPQIYIYYLVDDDNYLATYALTQSDMVFGVKLPKKEAVEIRGKYASGTLMASILSPKKNVSGDYGPEYALIEFFNQNNKKEQKAPDDKNIKQNIVENPHSSSIKSDEINDILFSNSTGFEDVASDGQWIYYRNSSDNNKLYRAKIDGTSKAKVSDDISDYISLSGEWIYYTNDSAGGKLYKVKNDGSHRTKLNDDRTANMKIVDDWIYYENLSDKQKIYKISSDGSNRTKLDDYTAVNFAVVKDWIYYSTIGSIYKIKTDGTNKTKICKFNDPNDPTALTYWISVAGDWVYYDYGSGISRVKTDGSDNTNLNIGKTGDLKVDGSWIYYSSSNGLSKAKLDGSSKTLVCKDAVRDISLVGDYIFYKDGSGKGLYKVKKDGSNKMTVN